MEEYVEVPSDSGITFNVKPKMKALEIAKKARDAILSGKFDQVRFGCLDEKSLIFVSDTTEFNFHRSVSICLMETWWDTLVTLRPL